MIQSEASDYTLVEVSYLSNNTNILTNRYGVRNVCIMFYHHQLNTIIEILYLQIMNGLAKLGLKWVKNLPFGVWV